MHRFPSEYKKGFKTGAKQSASREEYAQIENIRKCAEKFSGFAYEAGKAYCNSTYDSFLCWPPTRAGEIALQNCPATRLSDSTRKAVRKCGEEGKWLGRNIDESNAAGWTNYTPCFPPEVQNVFIKVFKNEKIAQEKFQIAQTTRNMEIVGFFISLVALIVSLGIFSYFRSLRNNRTKIHKSLFTAMILQVVIRLTVYIDQAFTRNRGEEYNTNSTETFKGIENVPYLCEASYTLLEYANSVMFMWMFIEGLYLHNVVTANALRERISHVVYYLIGWGLPLVVTVIWAAVTAHHYLQENIKTCWYGYNFNALYWIVQGPRLAVISINMLFLLNIMRVLIVKLRQTKTTETEKMRKAVHAALVLLPLLGITNALNMVEVGVDSSIWKFALWCYITHFLRSFQGFFLALIYCFLNAEVRMTVKKHYNNYMAMRIDPRYPSSTIMFIFGKRKARKNVPETDGSTWIQMTKLRLAHINSKDDRDIYDSDSSSFDPPCDNYVRDDDSSDNGPDGTQAAVTIVTQAEVNVQCDSDSV